jgi:hypothetical protein
MKMRTKKEIEAKCEEMFEHAWYHRHRSIGSPAVGEAAAFEIECKYGKANLDDYCEDCAAASMAALRWALGDDWDNKDT